jgi:hypothetical protein
VLRDLDLTPNQIWGLTRTDQEWSAALEAALEAALTATRRDALRHGTNAAYAHGCVCWECREHQRIRMRRTAPDESTTHQRKGISAMPDLENLAAEHVVGGLAEVLNALGAEFRQANTLAGETTILFGGAEIELNVALEPKAGGGVEVFVVNAEAGSTHARRSAKVTVQVYRAEPDEFEAGPPRVGPAVGK